MIAIASAIALAIAGACGVFSVWGLKMIDNTAENAEPLSIEAAAARAATGDSIWVRLVGASWDCETRHLVHDAGDGHDTEILLADRTQTIVVLVDFNRELSCHEIRQRPAIGLLSAMSSRHTGRAEILYHFPNATTFLSLCTGCGRSVVFPLGSGLLALVGLAIAAVWLRSAFWPAARGVSRWDVGNRPDATETWRDAQRRPFFYANRTRWLWGDQYFKIYVSTDVLAGAYIAGQFAEPRSIKAQYGWVIQPYADQCLLKRLHREARYEDCDPFSTSFLELDSRNFHILRSDVDSVVVSKAPSLFYQTSVGTVAIQTHSGSDHKLILLGEQSFDRVLKALSVFAPDAQVDATRVTARYMIVPLLGAVLIALGMTLYFLNIDVPVEPMFLVGIGGVLSSFGIIVIAAYRAQRNQDVPGGRERSDS